MVQHVFSDELGACWHFAFGSSLLEIQDVLNLLNVLFRVVLNLHVLSYQLEDAGEALLRFAFQDLVNVKFFILLLCVCCGFIWLQVVWLF